MQKIIKIGLFSFILGLTACQEKTVQFESVDVDQFSEIITENNVQLVDVRSAEEYAEGHIANSINLDGGAADFAEKANAQLNKENKVAVYCRSGRRSKMAAETLTKEGFNVVELDHGFNSWKESQKEIEK